MAVLILDTVKSGVSTNNQSGVCFNRMEEVVLVSEGRAMSSDSLQTEAVKAAAASRFPEEMLMDSAV